MQRLPVRSGNGVILAQRAQALLAPWVSKEATLAAIASSARPSAPVPTSRPARDGWRSPQQSALERAPAVPGARDCAAGE